MLILMNSLRYRRVFGYSSYCMAMILLATVWQDMLKFFCRDVKEADGGGRRRLVAGAAADGAPGMECCAGSVDIMLPEQLR